MFLGFSVGPKNVSRFLGHTEKCFSFLVTPRKVSRSLGFSVSRFLGHKFRFLVRKLLSETLACGCFNRGLDKRFLAVGKEQCSPTEYSSGPCFSASEHSIFYRLYEHFRNG